MPDDLCRVDWIGHQTAIVTVPEQVRQSDEAQLRDELLSVISRGVAELIVDMTATTFCDHAGADALGRAHQQAVINGTRLRLVVTAQLVRRVLSLSGLDRLVAIYPSLEAALEAGASPVAIPLAPRPRATRRRQDRTAGMQGEVRDSVITPAVLWQMVDALDDGVALVYDDGVVALANRRLEEMFGYERAELIDRPVESLMPVDVRATHRGYRADYARAPDARPMAARARLVGLRKDGTTFPVRVSLAPVPTATGHFTLVVVRDAAGYRDRDDLAGLARAAAAGQVNRGQRLLDNVMHSLVRVGLSLQSAIDLPSETARQHIAEALHHLDATIQEIRDHVFAADEHQPPPADPAGHPQDSG